MDQNLTFEIAPEAAPPTQYNIGDLTIETQRQVKQLIQQIKQQYTTQILSSFDNLRDEVKNRPFYVMFEPKLNTDALSDHQIPRSVLPIFEPFLKSAEDTARVALDGTLTTSIITAFGRTYSAEIDVKYKQQLKIDSLEVDLRRFHSQTEAQSRLIESLQNQIVQERQNRVKESLQSKEQIYQKNRVGGKYQPDFSLDVVPDQVQMNFPLPEISTSQKYGDSKLDATKLKILSQQCAVMQRQISDGEKVKKENIAMKGQIKQFEGVIEAERADNEILVKSLKTRLAELEKNNCVLEEQFSDAQVYLDRKQETIEQMRSEMKDFENLEKQYHLVAQEYTKLKSKNDKTTREFEKLKVELEAKNAQNAEIQEEVGQKVDLSSQQIKELNSKLNELVKNNEELEIENDRLNEVIAQKDAKSHTDSTITDSVLDSSIAVEKPKKKKKITKEFEQQYPESQLSSNATKSNLFDSQSLAQSQGNAIQSSNVRDVIAFRTEFDNGRNVQGFNWSVDDVDDVMKKLLSDTINFRSQLRGRTVKRIEQTQFLKEMFGKEVEKEFIRTFQQDMKQNIVSQNSDKSGQSYNSQSESILNHNDEDFSKIQKELERNLNQDINTSKQSNNQQKSNNILNTQIDQIDTSQLSQQKRSSDQKPPLPINQKKLVEEQEKHISQQQKDNVVYPLYQNSMDSSINNQEGVLNVTRENISQDQVQFAPSLPDKESKYINYKPGVTAKQSDNMLDIKQSNQQKQNNPIKQQTQNKLSQGEISQNKLNINKSQDKIFTGNFGPSSVTTVTKSRSIKQIQQGNTILASVNPESTSKKEIDLSYSDFNLESNDNQQSNQQVLDVQTFVPISHTQENKVKKSPVDNILQEVDQFDELQNIENPDEYNDVPEIHNSLTSIEIDPSIVLEDHIDNQVNESLALQIKAVASNHSIISLVNNDNDNDISLQFFDSDIDDEDFIKLIEQDSGCEDLVIEKSQIKLNPSLEDIKRDDEQDLNQQNKTIEKSQHQNNQLNDLVNQNVQQKKLDIKNKQISSKDQLIELLGGSPKEKVQPVDKQLQTETQKKDIIVNAFKDQLFTFVLNNDVQDQQSLEQSENQKQEMKDFHPTDEVQFLLTDKFIAEKVLQGLPLDSADLQNIARQLYQPSTLKKVVQLMPNISNSSKQIIQQMFNPNTVAQFTSNPDQNIIKQIFFNKDFLPLLVDNPDKIIQFQSKNFEEQDIKEAISIEQINDIQPFEPQKMTENLQVCLEDFKFENAHGQLISKLKKIFADDFYQEILKGNLSLTEEARIQILEIIQDPNVIQKFLQTDIDKNTAKKLFLLYEPGRIQRLQNNQVSSEEVKRIIDILLDPEVIKILFGDEITDDQLKEYLQIRNQSKQIDKQIKSADNIILNKDTAQKMTQGQLDRSSLNAIIKTFYSKNVSDLISKSKFTKDTAKQISTVLYNPQFMKILQNNDNADHSMDQNIQKLAQVVYNPEVIKLLQSNIQSKEVRETAKQCASIVQNEIKKVNLDETEMVPFQVITNYNDIADNVKSNTANTNKSRHQMSQIQPSKNVDNGYQSNRNYKSSGGYRKNATVSIPIIQGNDRQAPSFIRSFQLPGDEIDNQSSFRKSKINNKSPNHVNNSNIQQKINNIRYSKRQDSPVKTNVVPCCIVGLSENVTEQVPQTVSQKPIYKNLHDQIRREQAEKETVTQKQQDRLKQQEKMSLLSQIQPVNNDAYLEDRRAQANQDSFKKIIKSVGKDKEGAEGHLGGYSFKKL